MFRSRWITAVGAAILAATLSSGVAFAAHADSAKEKLSPGVQQLMTEIRSLRHERMKQFRAEAEAKIDAAVKEGRITQEEANRILQRWKAHQHKH